LFGSVTRSTQAPAQRVPVPQLPDELDPEEDVEEPPDELDPEEDAEEPLVDPEPPDELDPEEDVEEPAPFDSSERAPHPLSAATVEASQSA
jgi:hypothetical protein